MSKRYIPQGAILVCNKGQKMTELKVTHNNNVTLYKVPYANEKDKEFKENVESFGNCAICGKCKFEPLCWKPVHESVKIGGARLIHEESKLYCKEGGEISVHLNLEEAKKALQSNDFNKQPAYKKVAWLRVGGAFLGALVVGAAVAFTMGAALPILGAAAATGMAAMGASCGTIALAGTIATTTMQVIGTFGMLAGAYYSYKRWEESGFDLEEGLVILAEALGGAIGGGIGGKYGLKVGNKAVDKFFGNNPNYLAVKNGTKCFIAGTLIATEKGKKRIEELKYGEKVYSYDEFYKEKALRRIRDVHEHITDTLVRIKTKTEEILTTPEHPFYVKGRYILAGFLSVGMSLTSFAGEQIEIQETEIIRYEKPQKVYNFSIEGTENYYVGEQGVLVHNAGGCPSGNEARKKNTETKQTSNPITKEGNKKVLKTNVEYTDKNGYKYTTDNSGNITKVEVKDLKLGKGERNTHSQKIVGREDRITNAPLSYDNDDGGHLIATRFKGSGDIDNMIAQNRQVNRSGGAWYEMEQEWANALKEGKQVSVKMDIEYPSDSMRPAKFKIEYKIDGKLETREIMNRRGGK